jgi:hypothetical protein
MILSFILILPFLLQGGVMLVDEFYFHKKRGLPRWEQIGHPLDTLTVLCCFLWLNSTPPKENSLFVFVALSAFSCLFVTKDEFVHRQYCSAGEQWAHALLFILHPICFLSAGWMWWFGGLESVLQGQSLLLFLFLIYQTLFWNILWKPKTTRLQSTPSLQQQAQARP